MTSFLLTLLLVPGITLISPLHVFCSAICPAVLSCCQSDYLHSHCRLLSLRGLEAHWIGHSEADFPVSRRVSQPVAAHSRALPGGGPAVHSAQLDPRVPEVAAPGQRARLCGRLQVPRGALLLFLFSYVRLLHCLLCVGTCKFFDAYTCRLLFFLLHTIMSATFSMQAISLVQACERACFLAGDSHV